MAGEGGQASDTAVVTRVDLDDPSTEVFEGQNEYGLHQHPPTPNRAHMRDGESYLRSHAGTVEAAELEARILQEHPGRVAGYEPGGKPAPGSTPWQSLVYVNGRNSADGNPYRPGDTIPEAEAERQGLIAPEPVMAARTSRRPCLRCGGTGMFSKQKPRGHAPDCGCMFCGVCPACEGTRYEREVA